MPELDAKMAYSLLESINPQMDPETAVDNVRRFNALQYNPSQAAIYGAWAKLLSDCGYDPDEWVFFTNTKADPEEDFTKEHGEFPEEVELIFLQGAFIGGVKGNPDDGLWNVSRYTYFHNWYSVFIRVKQRQLT